VSDNVTRSLLLFLGGGLGANLRFWFGQWIHTHSGDRFPWGTLVVNATGCLAIGLVMGLTIKSHPHPHWRVFLVAGLLGGYTTFSAFAYETLDLVTRRGWSSAMGNVVLSVAAGLIGAWLGLMIARAL